VCTLQANFSMHGYNRRTPQHSRAMPEAHEGGGIFAEPRIGIAY
jgi:hypothetical protein